MTNPEHLRICVNCDKGWIEHVRDEACGEYLPVCGADGCRRPRGHDGYHDCVTVPSDGEWHWVGLSHKGAGDER